MSQNTHTLTAMVIWRFSKNPGPGHVVVTQADPVIWIAEDVMAELKSADRRRTPGDMDLDGDLISIGTPGEGLGRLTYRLTGRQTWHIAEMQVQQ